MTGTSGSKDRYDTDGAAVPADLAAVGAARRQPGARRRRADPPLRLRRRRHLRVSAASTRGPGPSTSSWPTTPPPPRPRASPPTARGWASARSTAPAPPCGPAGTAGSTSPSPPLSVVGVEGPLRRWRSARSRRRSTSPRRSPAASSAGAPRSAPRSPSNAFAQVTFAYRPVGTTGWTDARHRRQRAVPGVPGRHRRSPRAPCWSTAPSPRTAAATSPPPRRTASSVTPRPAAVPDRGPVGPVTQPDNVSVPGTHNSEMGCPGDWQPDCAQAQLTLDAQDQIWKGTYTTIPAGSTRLQGGDQQELGRELRRRREPRAAATSPTPRPAAT